MPGKKIVITIMAVLTGFVIASCGELPVKDYDAATELKSKVQKYDLSPYAPDEARKSEAFYDDGVKYYSKDNGKAKATLSQAITNYQVVIEKGFPAKIGETAAETESNKNEALGLKADRYLHEEFAGADALYHQAASDLTNKNYESAWNNIESAKDAFLKIYQQTKEKKDSSSLLLQQVRQKLDDVDQAAKTIRDEKANSEKIESSLSPDSETNN